MSHSLSSGGGVVLHLEFSFADAVRQRGLLPVLGSAVLAWWRQRPRDYSSVPAYLWDDLGVPPPDDPAHWIYIGAQSWRFPPPDRYGP